MDQLRSGVKDLESSSWFPSPFKTEKSGPVPGNDSSESLSTRKRIVNKRKSYCINK